MVSFVDGQTGALSESFVAPADPLQDGKSFVQLVDCMGGDLAVVNDARVSYGQRSTVLGEREARLIRYLIQHKHTSPLRSTVLKFHICAPLFVCRQWWKHVVSSSHREEQLGWNERSFRYTSVGGDIGQDSDLVEQLVDFYVPQEFRLQSARNKQSSEGCLEETENQRARDIYVEACQSSYRAYRQLLLMGVGREQARAVLVPSVYTQWVWTASLQAVFYFLNLRDAPDAQQEIQAYAHAIRPMVAAVVPVTMRCWLESEGRGSAMD